MCPHTHRADAILVSSSVWWTIIFDSDGPHIWSVWFKPRRTTIPSVWALDQWFSSWPSPLVVGRLSGTKSLQARHMYGEALFCHHAPNTQPGSLRVLYFILAIHTTRYVIHCWKREKTTFPPRLKGALSPSTHPWRDTGWRLALPWWVIPKGMVLMERLILQWDTLYLNNTQLWAWVWKLIPLASLS